MVPLLSGAGWYENNWFEVNLKEEGVNCTREQMAEAAEGHITTEALMWDQDNSTTISGMVSTSLVRDHNNSRTIIRYGRSFMWDQDNITTILRYGSSFMYLV